MTSGIKEVKVVLRRPHAEQERFRQSKAKGKVIRAGRRGGKTVGVGILANDAFIAGRRVLYAAPTSEQTDAFWYEIKRALLSLVETGLYKINETERYIEKIGTQNRIKAKTAYNADTLRGDYCDLLILDEWQLTAEDAWEDVGAPMLMDNNGDVVFIYTPPSLQSTGICRARDPRHASKMFMDVLAGKYPGWETFHFTSYDNPYISQEGLAMATSNMSLESYRREIMAEDDDIQKSWLVHSRFNEGLCKIKRFIIPKDWPIYSWHDFGQANPAALFVARVRLPLPLDAPVYMRLNDFVIWKEYAPGSGFSIAQHVINFEETSKGYTIEKRVGGNQTTEDEIRQGYAAHGWPIQAPSITQPNLQLDRVVGLEELNKLYIFEDLHGTLSQIASCMWQLDNENHPMNKIKDEAKFHFLACLRYGASSFTPETAQSTSYRQSKYN